MQLNDLNIITGYCEALGIKTIGDLSNFAEIKGCKNSSDLRDALIDEFMERTQKANTQKNFKFVFVKVPTPQGEVWRLHEGKLRTHWSIVEQDEFYVVCFKTTAVKYAHSLKEAQDLCVNAFRLFY